VPVRSQFEQMARRRLDQARDLDDARRRLDIAELRAVDEIALHPAALDHHRLLAAFERERRQHVEAGHAVHLAVVEVDRLRAAARGRAGAPGGAANRGLSSARKSAWSSARLLLLGVDAGLQRFFLRGARELPAAQRDGGRQRQDGRDGEEPEAAAATGRGCFGVQGFGITGEDGACGR
jgi:hypothetical protein